MPKDFWIGLVTLGAATFYWLEADKIRISPLDGPVGASGLPKTLALALGALSALLILRALFEKLRPLPDSGAPKAPLRERMVPHLRAMGMLGLGIGYVLLLPVFGYALTVAGLLIGVGLYIGARPDAKLFAVAIGGAIFFHFLFVEFLDVPLPVGAVIETILSTGA
ncbi:hypothetical protein HMH01_06985 [Halovulum dunhuangense]|uniref:DUF1468 domain-containing protein n=1 Tax=Halovulum dunhuangense TaxID=1505036 RepID=A0A849L1R6_9RHOB|nr:tripartite tricarboxylate transporter TctB family protein [Halovulum dunhuangense]NNU80181.1 hypothetical protein [Halovulum dunhuangense]